MKIIRLSAAVLCLLIGTVGFILPGSFLFLLAGLMLLSVDYPSARQWLKKSQRSASIGARKLDALLLKRKFR